MYVLLAVSCVPVRAQCVGDCDGNGQVAVSELVLGTNIALGQAEMSRCQPLDRDADGTAEVNELVEAVNAALRGCSATPLPTRTPTVPQPTATATATATPNATPQAQCRTVYRTLAEQPIDLTLPASDPEDTLSFAAEPLPGGAQLNAATGRFMWTPSAEQLGPFYLPFSATDTSSQTAQGEIFFKVSPNDACTSATCEPASGCTTDVVSLSEDCCDDDPLPPRVAEPVIPCPEGRVAFVGANVISGFGRLRNCDRLRFDVSGGQSAPALRFRIAARCLNTDFPVTIAAQLSTRTRANVFNRTTTIILTPRSDGFAQGVAIFALTVTGFDLEDAEANLRVRLTDVDQATTSHALRVILTSSLLDDLPDVDQMGPTPPPAPCGE